MGTISLEVFLELIPATLERWLKVHTDPETWAKGWHIDDAGRILVEMPVISNMFFSFDWKAAAYRRLAMDWIGYFYRCPECGDYGEELDCGCQVEPEMMEDLDLLAQSLQDYDVFIPDDVAVDALEQDGFPVYRQGVADTVDPIIEEVQEALARIGETEPGSDMVRAVQAAMSIMHHSGNITEDYADYVALDWRLLERVRDDGMAEIFGTDAMREYVS